MPGVRIVRNRAFSQADVHVVQKEPAFTHPPSLREGTAHKQEPYVEVQASPANWDEVWVPIGVGFVGPNNVFMDRHVGFPIHSILCDNLTYRWLQCDPGQRPIPPYTVGVIIPVTSAGQKAVIKLLAQAGLIDQTAVVSQQAWFGFSEAFLPPASGIILPAGYHT